MSKLERDALYDRCRAMNSDETIYERVKFVVVNGTIMKFTNCEDTHDGKLGRGTRDKSFKPLPENSPPRNPPGVNKRDFRQGGQDRK